MAAAERSIRGGRFAAACGVLSGYVKKAAAVAEVRPAAAVALPLMPGADVSVQEEHEAGLAPTSGAAHAQSQMAIFYGGRVLVLDEFPAYRAAELLRLAAEGAAAAQGAGRRGELADDLSMARKASLQRFMEKRKGRLAARGVPYRRPDGDACSDHLTLAL